MADREVGKLYDRIMAGERPIEELWSIRRSTPQQAVDSQAAMASSDLWNLAFHHEALFPKLEAAKALVEIALANDSTYPISTNDGLVYDALSRDERLELVQFIRDRMSETHAPATKHVLNDFVNDLLGRGPQV
jgi:hypothetical protein